MRTRKATAIELSQFSNLTRPIQLQMRSIIQSTQGKPVDEDARMYRALQRQFDQICNDNKYHMSQSGLRIRLD